MRTKIGEIGMRILILSCSTGEGHNAAGKAVMDCLIENGHEAVMIDMMSMAGPKISRLVGAAM